MLTHEELMELCQELQDAVDALLNAMRENGGIFNLDLDAHEIYMDNMIHTEDFLWAVYLDNRDSMSDEDAVVMLKVLRLVLWILLQRLECLTFNGTRFK